MSMPHSTLPMLAIQFVGEMEYHVEAGHVQVLISTPEGARECSLSVWYATQSKDPVRAELSDCRCSTDSSDTIKSGTIMIVGMRCTILDMNRDGTCRGLAFQ